MIALFNHNDYDIDDDELEIFLLDQGADPTLKNNKNQTALSIIKALYEDEETDENGEQDYSDEIEKRINRLATHAYEIEKAKDDLIEDTSHNYLAKVQVKNKAIIVLKNISAYIKRDYKKALSNIHKLHFEIGKLSISECLNFQNITHDDVISEFEKIPSSSGYYLNAQFEIASFLFMLTGNAEEYDRSQLLTKALAYSDKAKTPELSTQILNILYGKKLTNSFVEVPLSYDERLIFLSKESKKQEQKILKLTAQLEEQARTLGNANKNSDLNSASHLIRKRSNSPIYSNQLSKIGKVETVENSPNKT